MSAAPGFEPLLADIRACARCAAHLPLGPRPILQAAPTARLLIAGQAPGRITHASGIPFDDISGRRLRAWLGLTDAQFYDASLVAILPMGFCFPGTGKGGDAPPRPECAAWRPLILPHLPDIGLTLILGRYALDYHLPGLAKLPLAAALKQALAEHPHILPMPHPSPRNQRWLTAEPWFEAEVLPALRGQIAGLFIG